VQLITRTTNSTSDEAHTRGSQGNMVGEFPEDFELLCEAGYTSYVEGTRGSFERPHGGVAYLPLWAICWSWPPKASLSFSTQPRFRSRHQANAKPTHTTDADGTRQRTRPRFILFRIAPPLSRAERGSPTFLFFVRRLSQATLMSILFGFCRTCTSGALEPPDLGLIDLQPADNLDATSIQRCTIL